MNDLQTDSPSPRKPRRLFRFGLKTVFILMTLCGILFGSLWNFWWLPSEEQRQAVELIDSRCGYGGVEYGDYRHEPMDDFPWWKKKVGDWFGRDTVARVTLAFSDGTGEPIDISAWEGLKHVERVGFDHAIVDDLAVLENFKKLNHFSVFQSGDPTPPGKVGLEVLALCPQLETVKLTESRFTFNDQVFDSICNAQTIRHFKFEYRGLNSLAPLGRLVHLEELNIYIYCRFSPPPPNLDAIGKLLQLKKLTLHLRHWNPTDFSFLKDLNQLESCLITGVSSDDIKQEIQDFVPDDCEVKFSF